MPSITRVTLTPLSDGKGHAGKYTHAGGYELKHIPVSIPTMSRYQGALLPVELSQRHPQFYALPPEELTAINPDIGGNPKRSGNILPEVNTPYQILLRNFSRQQEMITRLGAVVFTVL